MSTRPTATVQPVVTSATSFIDRLIISTFNDGLTFCIQWSSTGKRGGTAFPTSYFQSI